MVVAFLVIFSAYGIASLVFPEYVWYFEKGIWYKDSEPTDGALLMTRIGGIIMLIVALFFVMVLLWG